MGNKYTELEIDTVRCVGCEICVVVCRRKVLALKETDGKLKAAAVWSVKCSGCGLCSAVCPTKAIRVNKFDVVPAL